MPGTKRSSKVLSYNEQDDDDDFVPTKKINDKKVGSKPSPPSPKRQPEKIEPVSSESLTSSHDMKYPYLESDVEEQKENSSPESTHVISEDSNNQNEEEESIEKPVIPTVQSKTSTTRRHSTVPLGFPTSKINIPSPHISRVGLSRKSLPVKPLHPNLISRIHSD